MLITLVQASVASLSDSPPATPRRSERSIVNHLNAWLKNTESQDNACIAQSFLDHVKEVERNKAASLAIEEDIYEGELEGFKNTMDLEVEEVFQSSQNSLGSESNVYPSSPLSVLPPKSQKKKDQKTVEIINLESGDENIDPQLLDMKKETSDTEDME